ncbi:kinase-like domain-containing protein [Mycena alexandri]|uniref:Kinase-like domain-containing protein n=1 Tax=Mycena alexandri TaxID=1745969 RepID=A0AAD6XAJ5_9AGAR|nr:kinase-like domain-containing protein [Mycena alexandri]
MRITTAHTLFSRWKHWDDLTWVIEEYAVWSEIHRVASTSQNWKGKRWSDKWAKEVHNLANKLREAEITADKKQRVAFSLRRLSQRTDFGDISTELVSTALRFGDSATLPSELLIAPQKLDLGPSEFVLGGSCTVRFGYYKIYGKREEVAIKEFDLTASTKIKLRIAQEAFTWRELSKTNRDFIVQFFGAEMSDKHLRLISQRMAHGDIVAFLNLETNKNETIRLKTISRVARAIAWMHSKDFIHGDIKGENVFVDAHGNPKHVPTPRTYSLSLSQYANDESIQSAITNSSLRLRGSIRWMAPESFENPASGPTKKRDVYAFAYLVLEVEGGYSCPQSALIFHR